MVVESKPTRFKPFNFWLWFSLAYGILLGGAFYCLDSFLGPATNSIIFGLVIGIAYSIALATIILVGAWSVLGPGQLWKRFIISNAFGFIVLAGLIIANFLCFYPGNENRDMALYCCIGFLCLSVSSQIVFWFLRGFFGWQFVYRDLPPRATLILSEIFIIIFMFAALSSMPNLIAKMNAEREVSSLTIGETSYKPIQQADGTFMLDEELVTAENIEKIRKEKIKQASSTGISSVLAMIAYATVPSLLAIPIFWFTFRSKTIRLGWTRSFIYGPLVVCTIGMAISLATSGTNFPIIKTILSFLLGGVFFVAALAWPLVISRKIGFGLITGRSFSSPS